MEESLKHKSIRGIKWSGIDSIATQVILALVNIILARILSPSDFGVIAEIAIFTQVSTLFIDGGFASALIQKKNKSNIDYCTVFYYNVAVAVICYLLVYIAAPSIARFFNNGNLIEIIRIISISFVLSSLISVHKTKLKINIQFKEQSIVSVISTVVSGVIAVIMALNGFGVWCLVFQNILSTVFQMILIVWVTKWIPKLIFSWEAFKKMFDFSSKAFLSSFINLIYVNLYSIFIGKKYDDVNLGYFNRGDFFARLPAQTISNVISKVAYPIFSTIQDDDERLKNAYSKYIQFTGLITFPIMIGLLVLSRPAISVVLTDKWIMVVPILQILCIDWMLDFISQINLNVLYVKGRSDLALRLEIIKKIIAVIILLATFKFGIIIMCWGKVLYSIIATYMNTFYTKRLIDLSRKKQISDILPFLLASIVMGVGVYFTVMLFKADVLKIIFGIPMGIATYSMMIFLIKKDVFIEFIGIIKNRQ